MRAGMILVLGCLCAPAQQVRQMSLSDLHDKIEGGWAGQMIGVSYGAPTEFRSNGKINEAELPPWKPDRVSNSLNQDDLYVDMTFAKVIDDKGLDATSDDFGAMFKDARYSLWHANLAARRALRRGVPATLSGTPKYNAHANDIDFQIESDFIGLMAPGLPQAANDIAWRAGRVMNYGDGIYGGMFVAGMYAAAFFERDPRKVVQAGLASIPSASPYARLITDVLAWSKQYPGDWKKVWQLIEDKWDRRDPCPDGALRPFNIDAKLNGAYIALGLLYGGRDFGKTLEISTRSGQDSDCNPASAGGILGVMLGYRNIPEEWKGGIPAIADQKFRYTDFSFHTIVESNEKRTLALIQKTGGKVEGDKVAIRTQKPVAPKLELWDDYGWPVERIAANDPRWSWQGNWQRQARRNSDAVSRTASERGADATVTFQGTGAIVTGPYLPNGGELEVYLDGKLDGTVDAYSDERSSKGGEAVWHGFGLKDGTHSVRLVVLGKPYPGSGGSVVTIDDIVVFRPAQTRRDQAGWAQLSSKRGELPVPGESHEQTGALIAKVDPRGSTDFILSFRKVAPALLWYRRQGNRWDRYVIEKEFLTLEAGGAAYDIDGDGDLDIVFGGDYQSNALWWWENPAPDFDPNVSWKRHTIKNSGARQHHDQIFADFKGTGKPQLVFWNQGAKTLFLAEIPKDPRNAESWPLETVFSGQAGEGGEGAAAYAEGLDAIDVDGDGRVDLLAGNYWFPYVGGKFRPVRVADLGGRIRGGRFQPGKTAQIVIAPGDGSGPLRIYTAQGDPAVSASWRGRTLLDRDMVHGHTLEVGDIDGDGNLDIFAAEMAKWSNTPAAADHPDAMAWILYGDGRGNFKPSIFSTGIGWHEGKLGDLNGDGRLDILCKPYTWDTPRVDIWLNNPRNSER